MYSFTNFTKSKFWLVLLIFVTFFICTYTVLEAQETVQQSAPVKIAGVDLQDCTFTSQTENDRSVSAQCVISNDFKSQGDIRYGIQIIRRSGGSAILEDTHIFSEALSVNENDSVPITMAYTFPKYLEGDFEVWGVLKTPEGLPLSGNFLGKVTIAKLDEPYLYIDVASCQIRVGTGSDAKLYAPGFGVDVDSDEKLFGECAVKAVGGDFINTYPSVSLYERTLFGDMVATAQDRSNPFDVFTKNEQRKVTFSIQKVNTPQAYDAVFEIVDDGGMSISNKVVFHYVLRGPSATIKNILLNRDSYEAGDSATVTLTWTGSSDDFIGSRFEPTKIHVSSVAISMSNKNGDICADEKNFTVEDASGTSGILKEYSLEVKAQCVDPVVMVRLNDGEGGILAKSTVQFNTVVNNDEFPKGEDDNKERVALGIIILLVTVMISIAFLSFRKIAKFFVKSNSSGTLSLILFVTLFGISMVVSTQKIEAATYTVSPCFPLTLPDGTIVTDCGTFEYYTSLDKSSYYPNSSIVMSAGLSQAQCSNQVYLGSDFVAKNVPTGETIKLMEGFSSNCGAGSNSCTTNVGQWETANFTAPAAPGIHNFDLSGSWVAENVDWGSFPIGTYSYTVTALPQPAMYTHSCSADGTQVTLSWGAVPSATAYPLRVDDLSGSCLSGTSGPSSSGCQSGVEYISNTTGITGTSAVITIKPNTSYQWWVHAYDGLSGTWSDYKKADVACVNAALPSNGSCGSSKNTCTIGTFSEVTDVAPNYKWNCTGLNGGATAACTLPMPACANTLDDDSDGYVDMNDPGCASTIDTDETNVILDHWIAAGNCKIATGASSCNSNVSWSTTHASPSIKKDSVQFSTAQSNTGTAQTIAYGSHTFQIYNGATLVVSDAAHAICDKDDIWNPVSGKCEAVPITATITANDCAISNGQSTCNASVSWSTTGFDEGGGGGGGGGGGIYPSIRQDGVQFNDKLKSDGVQRSISYGVHSFTVYNGVTQLALDQATASCSNGTWWNSVTNVCSLDFISAEDCWILAGADSCNSDVSWSTTQSNPSIKKDSVQFSTAQSNPGTAQTIAHGSHTFTMYKGTNLLASDAAEAKCIAGTQWDVSVCKLVTACSNNNDDDYDGLKDYPDDPGCTSALDTSEENQSVALTPTIKVNKRVVRVNDTVQLSWDNGGSSCTISGGTLSSTTVLAPGSIDVVIKSLTKFTIDCGVGGKSSVIVEIVPTTFET